jgi:hypothetical protein
MPTDSLRELRFDKLDRLVDEIYECQLSPAQELRLPRHVSDEELLRYHAAAWVRAKSDDRVGATLAYLLVELFDVLSQQAAWDEIATAAVHGRGARRRKAKEAGAAGAVKRHAGPGGAHELTAVAQEAWRNRDVGENRTRFAERMSKKLGVQPESVMRYIRGCP